MNFELQVKNFVAVGEFEVELFDKYFFIKNGIVNEDEIIEPTLFNQNAGPVIVTTKDFQIFVAPTQLIVTDTSDKKNIDIITKIEAILKFCKKAINAIGLNFHYFDIETSLSLFEKSRQLFYRDSIDLLKDNFDSEGSAFGVYASKDVKKARLKLEVKPSGVEEVATGALSEVMVYIFNFHFDTKDVNLSEIVSYVQDYDYYKTTCESILKIS